MRALIYGGGAVGLGLGSCLINAGAHVDILARPRTVAALNRAGLIRRGIFGTVSAKPPAFRARHSLDDLAEKTYDVILVTVKSFDSQSAASDIFNHRSLWSADTPVILCQNGWGNAEVFSSLFNPGQIYNARLITGFMRPAPNEVTVTVHADSVRLGSLFHRDVEAVRLPARLIAEGGIPCDLSDDIAADLWAKMLYNGALNPLSAVLGVPYGKLGEAASTRELMDDIIDEIYRVMTAAGYRTRWAAPRDYRKIFYEKLLPSTAGHYSSMLQDIQAGKRTEIDALNGMVVTLADRHNQAAPNNRCVTRMIRFLEKGC